MFEQNDNYIPQPDLVENDFDKVVIPSDKTLETENNQDFLKYQKITNEITTSISNQTRFSDLGLDISDIGNQIFNKLRTNDNYLFQEDDNLFWSIIEDEIVVQLLKEEENKKIEEENKKIEEENKKIEIKVNEGEANKSTEEANKSTEEANKSTEDLLITTIQSLDGLYLNFPSEVKGTETDILELKQEALKSDPEIEDKLEGKIDPAKYFQFLFAFKQITQLQQNGETISTEQTKFIETFQDLNNQLDIQIQRAYFMDQEKKNSMKTLSVRSKSLNEFAESGKIVENPKVQNLVSEKINNSKTSENINLQMSDLKDLPKYKIQEFAKANPYIKDDGSIDTDKIQLENPNNATNIINKIQTQIDEFIEAYQKQKKGEISKSIHERVVANCFKGLVSYFDRTTKNMENFADDVKLDVQNDVTMINKDTIYIRGSIKGKNIGMYYNINTGEMEMDDFLAKNNNGEIFIGPNHGNKEKLKLKLPTYDQLLRQGEKMSFLKIFENAESEDDFNKNLNKSLDDQMGSQFGSKYVNKFFVEKHMEEYIAEQEVLDGIFGNWFKGANYNSNIDFRINDLNIKPDNKNQYRLISMIYNTLEDQRNPSGIRRLRDGIDKLNYFIEKAVNPNEKTSCPKFDDLFSEDKMREGNKDWINNSEEMNYLKFFNLIGAGGDSNPRIDLNLLEKVNITLEKNESLSSITNHVFAEKYENLGYNPDDIIDNNNLR